MYTKITDKNYLKIKIHTKYKKKHILVDFHTSNYPCPICWAARARGARIFFQPRQFRGK